MSTAEQTELDRIASGVSGALTALAEQGVNVPTGARADDLPELIAAIPKPNVKVYEITLTKKSGWVTLATLDADVLAHMNDADLMVTLEKLGAYEYVYYAVPYMIAKNTQVGIVSGYPVYGNVVRLTGENIVNSPNCHYKPNDSTTNTSLGKARFRLNGNNFLAMPADGFFAAGTYRLTFHW